MARRATRTWIGLASVCFAYLAVSVGESLLSPLFPTAADDLGLDLTLAGVGFGVLTVSIALANVAGGYLLPRVGVTRMMALSAVLAAIGGVVAATAQSFPQLAGAQVLLGAGSGLYFPGGLQALGLLAGSRRTGFATGVFGVAFSGGLAIAAVLGALGADQGWRVAFAISTVLSVVAAATSWRLHVPPAPPTTSGASVRDLLGMPTVVGSVGAMCQYGTVSYLTVFAVEAWGLSMAAAAALLAIGRVLSIVAKLLSGASADRRGARASTRRIAIVLVAAGVGWVTLPAYPLTYALAALFAGTVSSVFPVANMLALERFRGQRGALGLYRSLQIGFGALATFVVGLLGDVLGLRPVLAVTVVVPLGLLWLCREPRTAAAPSPAGGPLPAGSPANR